MKILIKTFLNLINAIAILGLSLSYLSPFVDPQDFWIISFFGLTYTFWLGINIIFLLLWILSFKRRGIYNALILIVGFQFITRNVQFSTNKNISSDIKICSFNTHVQQTYNSDNTSVAIDQYLTNQKYDVALLVEWLNNKGNINKIAFPHQHFVNTQEDNLKSAYGLKLVSKHPILNCERIKYNHSTNNLAVQFDVDVEGQIIRFVGVHLQSNSVSPKDYQTLMHSDLNNDYKTYAFAFIDRLKKQSQLRTIQTQTILEAIDNSPYPVIILGDFNDTPQSFIYQQFKEGRKDAFVEKGSGWEATYLKPLPFLRIDYIFYDSELVCTDYQSSTSIKSDHSLIEASFQISK